MSQSLRQFWVIDLHPSGDVRSTERYTYALLQQIPSADDLITQIATELYRNPNGFELHVGTQRALLLRFAPISQSSAALTVRERSSSAVVSFSLMLTEAEPAHESISLDAFQKQVVRELHGTEHEASFAIRGLTQRPALISLSLHDPKNPADRAVAAVVDRCAAAAYFRYHHCA